MSRSAAVVASNALTARWCRALDGSRDTVLSGAGLWPLLAVLASGADGSARSELVEAIERPAEAAQQEALDLLDILQGAAATSAALGLFVSGRIALHDKWTELLPSGVLDRLVGIPAQDQPRLDVWAREHTTGLIQEFPLEVAPADDLVLATALTAITQWCEPFRDSWTTVDHGPWEGTQIPLLRRVTPNLDDATVIAGAAGRVTRVVVAGRNDLDVHLVIGTAEAPAGSVLTAGLEALTATDRHLTRARDLGRDAVAPGLRVRRVDATEPGDRLGIRLPPFTVRSEHDLTERPELFGLAAAMSPFPDPFPGMSADTLCVRKGAQSVTAEFSELGFKAAALTAFATRGGSGRPAYPYRIRYVEVDFERPFGFIAVHRLTGLAVVAGWVASAPAVPAFG